MARFGQFMKDQLLPEDPLDWVIMILVVSCVIVGIVILMLMASSGLI